TTVFLTHISDWALVNEVYAQSFGDHRPARSAFAVAGLPMGGLVEIEAWACAPREPTATRAQAGPASSAVPRTAPRRRIGTNVVPVAGPILIVIGIVLVLPPLFLLGGL